MTDLTTSSKSSLNALNAMYHCTSLVYNALSHVISNKRCNDYIDVDGVYITVTVQQPLTKDALRTLVQAFIHCQLDCINTFLAGTADAMMP